MGLLNTPTMNAFWRRLEKPQQRAYHFCAEYQVSPGEMQIFDGVATSNVAVSSPDFYRGIKATIAGAMQPPRPPEKVVLRSLTPLA